MGELAIDDVLRALDRPPPTYRELYYRWEREQWATGAIDFSEDRRQWRESISDDLERSLTWLVASFLMGDERVAQTLVPFVDAAPTEEHQVFLATQLVDEARHVVFLDLLFEQVLDVSESDMESRLSGQKLRSKADSRIPLFELIGAASDKLGGKSDDLGALIVGVLLHHIVLKSVAITSLRFMVNFARASELLPGFRRGFSAIARDEARHVCFGVRFLKEMVDGDPGRAGLIRRTMDDVIPVALSTFEPPDGDASYYDPLPYGAADLTTFARDSLSKRLAAIGIEAN